MSRNKIIFTFLFIFLVGGLTIGIVSRNMPRTDDIDTEDEEDFTIRCFGHASVAFHLDDDWFYVDPVSKYMNIKKEHDANYILITHSHADHLDTAAIAQLSDKKTIIIADSTSAKMIPSKNVIIFHPGDTLTTKNGVFIEAVPAYNTTPAHMKYHPRSRGDCGYILTMDGKRIYVAGDTEETPEMRALKNIDVAFLPINQPYTMTLAQAISAVNAFKPKIFYPYHYGSERGNTDVSILKSALSGVTEVRIRGME